MDYTPYKALAETLHALPNGYPPTASGVELRLLAKLFTPEEASLTSQLRLTFETTNDICARTGREKKVTRTLLKGMVQKGLIRFGRAGRGLGYGLMPFAVGFYETHWDRIDEEFAQLFEEYYNEAFGDALNITPQFHRVIPVNETIRTGMEVHPHESASEIISRAKSWGVVDCLCRNQKALVGDPCDHPLDVCMVFSQSEGAFDGDSTVRSLTIEESFDTLQRAADAGLVHSVSNNLEGNTYICNCCTCSCGILRGIADLGIANVVARSAFLNVVDPDACVGCEDCIPYCQFDALAIGPDGVIKISNKRCVGCGVCVPVCEDKALSLVRRPEDEVLPVPATEFSWMEERAVAREIDMDRVL